jgi:predicted aminopeptidase
MHDISIICRRGALALAALACGALGGCYLLQSAAGQLQLMSKRKPIARLIADPATPAAVKSQLAAVSEIREFASRSLGLPDNGSYRAYADVGRPYVVWNVVAAPEFSLQPKQWCYPIVGCVAYRGYFVERRARRYADALRKRGLDVSVEGVAAYSTLGHFDDPILNTMLGWDDVELASIIFHELTHQMIYEPGDADFDEALATTVEQEGVRRWLESRGREGDLARYRLHQERFARVLDLLMRTRAELSSLYASGADRPQMRRKKAAIFDMLRRSHRSLELEWGGHAPLSSWFEGEINNAQLASIATYYDCVPGFRRELEAAGGDLGAFYVRVRKLARLDQRQRHAMLCGTSTAEPPLP